MKEWSYTSTPLLGPCGLLQGETVPYYAYVSPATASLCTGYLSVISQNVKCTDTLFLITHHNMKVIVMRKQLQTPAVVASRKKIPRHPMNTWLVGPLGRCGLFWRKMFAYQSHCDSIWPPSKLSVTLNTSNRTVLNQQLFTAPLTCVQVIAKPQQWEQCEQVRGYK